MDKLVIQRTVRKLVNLLLSDSVPISWLSRLANEPLQLVSINDSSHAHSPFLTSAGDSKEKGPPMGAFQSLHRSEYCDYCLFKTYLVA